MSFIKALVEFKGFYFETFPLFFHYKLIKNRSLWHYSFPLFGLQKSPCIHQHIYACHPTVRLIFILILILNISEMNHCQGPV